MTEFYYFTQTDSGMAKNHRAMAEADLVIRVNPGEVTILKDREGWISDAVNRYPATRNV